MKSKLIPAIIANLFAAMAAGAADGGFIVNGEVGIGARSVSKSSDTVDAAKLNEYRDLKSGSLIGNVELQGAGDKYYVNLFTENLGLTDQFLDVKGGQYGVFKYQLYDNDLTHQNGFGMRTPYNGVGTNILPGVAYGSSCQPGAAAGCTTTARALPVAAWNTFDFNKKRQDFGGMFEFSNNSPWFLRVDGNQVKSTGLKPATIGILGLVEVPEPINWKTLNASAEAGYSTKQAMVTLSYMRSKFTDANDVLYFQDPTVGTSAGANWPGFSSTTMPPDNLLSKWGLNGALRQLPLNSTFSGRLSYQKLTNNIDTTLPGIGSQLTSVSNNPVYVGTVTPGFSGDIRTSTAALSLTSTLTKGLDSRIYYNYYKKENRSTDLTARTGTALTLFVPLRAQHDDNKKTNVGFNLNWRINAGNKLTAGYDYQNWDTYREDFDNVKDRKFRLEYKNTMLDNFSARVKYQYLKRTNTTGEGNETRPANTDAALLEFYTSRFDVADVNQNQLKLVLDWQATQKLGFGFESIYKKNDYRDTILGRDNDKRNEYILSANYGDANVFSLTAFADWEKTSIDSAARFAPRTGTVNTDPLTGSFCPVSPANAANCSYNWNQTNKEKNLAVGIAAIWPVTGKWTLTGSYMYVRTDGTSDFSSQDNLGTPTSVANSTIASYDNTRKDSWNLRAKYAHDRNWSFTGGVAYEKYRYSDDHYNGFIYNPIITSTAAGTTAGGYLTGLNANPNYAATIVYFQANYKFK